ncbi:MAG: tetratricopeptide repeat protein [Ignavibacteria bacterium]|jgi:tetratricopeptide (TPR) repeat protein|nr:tetratricopeptide repeat protein [Ignavibacteria bacterium]
MLNQVSATFAINAEKLLLNGSFDEAIAVLEEGLSLYPNYPSAICILAKAHFFAEHNTQATSIIKIALELYPTNVAIINTYNAINEGSLSLFPVQPQHQILNQDKNDLEEVIVDAPINLTPEDFEVEEMANEKEIEETDDAEEEKDGVNEYIQGISKIADLLKSASREDFDDIDDADLDIDIDMNMNVEEETIEEVAENAELIDEETFFPEHTLQESIASDIEETTNNETNDTIEILIDPLDQPEYVVEDTTDDEPTPTEAVATEEVEVIEEDIESIEEDIEVPEILEDEIEEAVEEVEENIPPPIYIDPNSNNASAEIYRIDLAMNRIDVPKDTLDIETNHLTHSINFNNIKFFTQSFNLNHNHTAIPKIDEIESEPELDPTTKEIIEIARGLQNAKIIPISDQIDEEDECDVPLIASDTMAKIFTKQKKFKKAIKIYEMLIMEKPDKADFYNQQIEGINAELYNN